MFTNHPIHSLLFWGVGEQDILIFGFHVPIYYFVCCNYSVKCLVFSVRCTYITLARICTVVTAVVVDTSLDSSRSGQCYRAQGVVERFFMEYRKGLEILCSV